MSAWLRRDGSDWVLALRIQPRAGRSGLVGVSGDRLKVRIAAPPADGRANDELKKWLADYLDVARAKIVIEQGLASRDKRVRILGVEHLPAELVQMAE